MKLQTLALSTFAAALLTLLTLPASAQIPLTPPSLGMGGAHMGLARGQEALFVNPAHLGLAGTPHWSVALPQVVGGATMLGLRFGDIDAIRNYDDLSDAESRALLARVPATGTEIAYELRAPLMAFQGNRFAGGVSYQTFGSHGIAYDVAELFLIGYELGRRDFDVRDTRGRRVGYMDFAVATGHRVGPVSLGATAHLYRGGTVVTSQLLDVEVDDLALDYRTTYISLRSEGGTGFGLDLGAAAQPIPGLTVSASVANALGSMNWTESLRQRSVNLSRNDVEHGNFELIRYNFDRSDAPYTSSADPLVQAMAAGILDEVELPRTLNLGAAYSLPSGTDLGATFRSTLNETQLTGMWDQSLSLGVQQHLSLLRLRAGLASDLNAAMMLTGGLAIGPVQFGIARVEGASVDSHSRTGWIATFGLATRSNTELR
jgi:hypothetical protein